jgi:hypothetical protein
LQQVFQTAQEQIGLAQGLRVAFRQQVQLLDGASVGSSERDCSDGSRPPRISWKT